MRFHAAIAMWLPSMRYRAALLALLERVPARRAISLQLPSAETARRLRHLHRVSANLPPRLPVSPIDSPRPPTATANACAAHTVSAAHGSKPRKAFRT